MNTVIIMTPQVLILDDDKDLIFALTFFFGKKSVYVTSCTDELFFVAKKQQSHFLLMLEYGFLQPNFEDQLIGLKEIFPLSNCFVMSSDKAVEQTALANGAELFLHKPLDCKVFISGVYNTLYKSRKMTLHHNLFKAFQSKQLEFVSQ